MTFSFFATPMRAQKSRIGFRRVAAATKPGDRRHPRIVPAADELLLDQRQQLPLAHHRVIQIQPRELDLLRSRAERLRRVRRLSTTQSYSGR